MSCPNVLIGNPDIHYSRSDLSPFPHDSKKLKNFNYQGMRGYRVDQGEYRIIYAVDDGRKKVLIGLILNRNEDYKELRGLK